MISEFEFQQVKESRAKIKEHEKAVNTIKTGIKERARDVIVERLANGELCWEIQSHQVTSLSLKREDIENVFNDLFTEHKEKLNFFGDRFIYRMFEFPDIDLTEILYHDSIPDDIALGDEWKDDLSFLEETDGDGNPHYWGSVATHSNVHMKVEMLLALDQWDIEEDPRDVKFRYERILFALMDLGHTFEFPNANRARIKHMVESSALDIGAGNVLPPVKTKPSS